MSITKAAIRETLINSVSAEFESDHIDYYLHIYDDGTIAPDVSLADATFKCAVFPSDLGITEEEYGSNDLDKDRIYAHEIEGDPVFDAVVDDLYKQACDYLADL